MARRVVKTMSAKMNEAGKTIAKDILDDTELTTDPFVNALQTLREQIDDLQHNDNGYGADKLQSQIDANTAKIGTTSTERTRIAANHAKISMVIGTGSEQAKAGNTKTIDPDQAKTITNLAKGFVVKTGQLTISKDRSNNLIITDGTSTWVLEAQDR